MIVDGPAAEAILAFADDEHLTGHRHSEWIGVAPFLEEDMAFASIAQDELGHAHALYGLLTDDVEHLALRRPAGAYLSCWLVEDPCRAWEDALVRHWLYDGAERLRWENLTASSVPELRGIAERALREEDYHRRHATTLVERLLEATEESRRRIVAALERLLPLAAALWEPPAGEEAAVGEGVLARSSSALGADWRATVEPQLAAWGVDLPWPAVAADLQSGRTQRSEHFAEIHEALTEVLRLDPAAAW